MAKQLSLSLILLNVAQLTKVSGTNYGSLYINTAVQPPAPVHPIPKTGLYTGIYYKLSLKRFPSNSITWTEKTDPVGGWNYVEVDSESDNSENFEKDGVWYNDAQWYFEESKTSSSWYTLRNRQFPGYPASIFIDGKVGSGYHIVLKEIDDPDPPDALWKPVAEVYNNSELYKLVIKSEPDAIVTWTETLVSSDEPNIYFIQVDVNSDPTHRGKYAKSREWFLDTLFIFEPVDEDLIHQLKNGSVQISPNFSQTVTPAIFTLSYLFVIGAIMGLVCLIIIATYLLKQYRSNIPLFGNDINKFFNGDSSKSNQIGTEMALSFKYDKARYEILESSYTINESNCLGSGEFGLVYAAFLNDKEIHVAAKTLKKRSRVLDQSSCIALKGLISEVKVLSYLGEHENVIKLYGANTAKLRSGSIYVFLELCTFGSLLSYLRNPTQNEIEETPSSSKTADDDDILRYAALKDSLCKWSKEIATGMAFLASKQLVHADLATRNVLLDANKTAKIADFGLSRRLYDYTHYTKTSQEPLPWRWMAPESLRKNEFCEKTDVWAYAVTVWEIYTLGDTPYPGLSWDVNFPTMLERGLKPGIPKYNEGSIYDLMLQCWAVKPEKRPTFSTIMTKWNSVEQGSTSSQNLYME